jgi:hypothetical protein
MKRAVLALLLAACGADQDPAPTPTPAPLAPTPSAAPAAAPAPAPAPAPSPAAAILQRYFDQSTILWRHVAAVLDSADDDGRFDHKRMRHALDRFEHNLASIDADLATLAADPSFAFEYCLACIERDWNLNNRIDDGDRLLLQIEVDSKGEELPENDPRRKPTFRFDVGDLHWARAMLAFQRAIIDIVLAYQWDALDQLLVEEERTDDDGMHRKRDRNPPPIKIKLAERNRIRAARDLILAGIDHAEKSRAAYLAETDDDREWVPSPRQKNHPVPLPMDQAMYDRWSSILTDVRRLVRGEEALSAGELGALVDDDFTLLSGYIDVGRLLDQPADFTIDFRPFMDRKLGPIKGTEKFLRALLGAGYTAKAKKSPLTGRLLKMKRELAQDEEELDRKLRYLLWLN